MLVPEEHLLETRFFKRMDHAVRMPQEMDVSSIFKIRLPALQHVSIEGVRRRLVYKRSLSKPSLQRSIKLFCRQTVRFEALHDFAGFKSVASFYLHDRPYGSFKRKAVWPRERGLSLAESVEAQEFQLRRSKQKRM